ncbi:MAG: maturation protein [Sanya fiers-like virus 48]|nr:MAG: maturation protein [Sanya fiers-like virus 48]
MSRTNLNESIPGAYGSWDLTTQSWAANGSTSGPRTTHYVSTTIRDSSFSRIRNSVVSSEGLSGIRLPENPFSFSKSETRECYGTYSLTTTYSDASRGLYQQVGCISAANSKTVSTYLGWFPKWQGTTLADAESRARQRCILKLREELKGASIMPVVSAAEAGKTASMIGDMLKTLFHSYKDLKRGDIRSAATRLSEYNPDFFNSRLNSRVRRRYNREYQRDASSAAAKQWLRWRYGIGPLILDISDAFRLLNEATTQVSYYRANARANFVDSHLDGCYAFTTYAGIGSSQHRAPAKVYQSVNIDVSMRVWYKITSQLTRDTNKAGINAISTLAQAYELVPFSFLYDWVHPIGPWLDSLSATAGLTFVKGSTTVFKRQTGLVVCSGSTSFVQGTQTYLSTGNFEGFKETISCTRVPMNDFPNAGFPSFRLPIPSTNHVLDALALGRQLLK